MKRICRRQSDLKTYFLIEQKKHHIENNHRIVTLVIGYRSTILENTLNDIVIRIETEMRKLTLFVGI